MDISDINYVSHHVQHFYEIIIPKATYSSDWDEQEIVLAFQWGKFCEEVYLKYADGDQVAQLDEILHSVSKECTHVYKMPLCFEDLHHSNLYLSQSFFDNASIDDSKIQTALESDELAENYFTKNMADMTVLSTLCCDLIESIKPIEMEKSDFSLYYETRSELFIDFLKNSLQQQSTGNFEDYLSSAFAKLCSNEENMEILLNVIMYDVDSDAIAAEIQRFAFNWMLLQLYSDNSCSLSKFLWKQPPIKMRELAVKDEAFSFYYLNLIGKCVNSLREIDGTNKDSWNFRPLTTSDVTLTFDQVLNHFQTLFCSKDKLEKETQEHIKSNLIANPDNKVWKEIMLELKMF